MYGDDVEEENYTEDNDFAYNDDTSEDYYCDICNVVCTGPQPYKTHLEGERHIRNEAKAAAGDDGQTRWYCDTCHVPCTGKMNYEAHLRGAKHLKALKCRQLPCKRKAGPGPSVPVDEAVVPKNKHDGEEKFRKDVMRVRQQVLWNIRAQYQSQLMPEKPASVQIDAVGPAPMFGSSVENTGETLDDRFVKAKNSLLRPTAEEKEAITRAVSNVEKALKQVSDHFVKPNVMTGSFWTGSTMSSKRNLKGVVWVEPSVDMMLRGDCTAMLVTMCEQKPTEFLVREIRRLMPQELQEPYDLTWDADECLLSISPYTEPRAIVRVAFTSAAMREADDVGSSTTVDPPDVLNRDKCVDALAHIRRAKCFQARYLDVENCTMMLRVMRGICRVVPTWRALNDWALQLLIQKALVSAGAPLSPGEAFRRIFEAVSSGILLLDGPGLLDPCEKDIVDAAWDMTPQEREDITASAHKALRLIAFGKIYRVLSVCPSIDEIEGQLDSYSGPIVDREAV